MGNNIKRDSRGFTLIAALLLTLLLSALAVGLLYTVNNEQRMGGNDLEGNMAYYGAEAGIETLTAQLSQLYQTTPNPKAADIAALTDPANFPTAIGGSNITNTNYTEPPITWPLSDKNGNPAGTWDIVGSGQDEGMVASLIQFNLQATATRTSSAGEATNNSAIAPTGASVNLSRTVEVALLPAFEFGLFCDGDCDYFAGPPFNFGGRIHANGNLFLASGGTLTFTDKVAAAGQIIMDQLENGHTTSSGYTGPVYIPSASGGCPAAPGAGPATNCPQITQGSWTGGFAPNFGAAASNWKSYSNAFNGFAINGLTGATKLQLPFVQGNTKTGIGSIDIIRRPQTSDTAALTNSRLYNEAEIRILLADDISQLHPERGAGALDSNDVHLTLGGSYATSYGTMYYASGQTNAGTYPNWVKPNISGCSSPWPLLGQVTMSTPCTGAWLRVEYLNNAGTWVGVTQQWLGYGFGKPYGNSPTAPHGVAGANPITPAILILQQLQPSQSTSPYSGAMGASTTQYNWLPINFYDAREGEVRDYTTRNSPYTTYVSTNGIMNAVELDAGNLWLWLQGKSPYIGGSGLLVNNTNENGYILYFSDRRGMQPDPDSTRTGYYNGFVGVSGLEDTINSGSTVGTPDGVLDPLVYYTFSPEDVDGSTFLDTFGANYLGVGFGLPKVTNTMSQAYFTGTTTGVDGPTTATWNMVTGPRHVLRVVDGGMDAAGNSYLPQPISPATSGNGFTVASENPVYVWGNYNSGPADPFFPSFGANGTTPHSAAAIIADSVTLLSNPAGPTNLPTANQGWSDSNSFACPGWNGCRLANDSYYRVAIAGGKSIPFPQPSWGANDFGTDGGMHNFLRYLESRGGTNVYYSGSLVSMYYSQYNTGTFKCCNSVYGAPIRNYFFDSQFLNPANLPPGTPELQDVVSLGFHQNFTPQ